MSPGTSSTIRLRKLDLGLVVPREGNRVRSPRALILFVCFDFLSLSGLLRGCGTDESVVFVTDNFMDYGDDTCLTSFTKGQAERARDQIAIYRGIKAPKQGSSSNSTGGGKQHTGRPGKYSHDRRRSFEERHGLGYIG